MTRLSTLLAAAVVGLTIATAPTSASAQVANSFITFAGLDWVWASPCPTPTVAISGCQFANQADLSLGWRVASPIEWAARPAQSDFLDVGGNHSGGGGQMRCGSYYFNTQYSHCDYSDPEMSGVGNGSTEWHAETWLVRDNQSVVPEPSTYALMAAGLAGIFGLARRRRA